MITFLHHSYGEFSPRQPLKPTLWPHFDLLFIHTGQLSLKVAGKGAIDLHTGEGILLFPETRFKPLSPRFEARASVQHFQIQQTDPLPTPFDRLAQKTHGALIYKGGNTSCIEPDIERAMAWAKLPDTPARQTMREALLTLILGEFLHIGWEGKPEQGAEHPEHLLAWASHQPLETLTVKSLAKAAGISESTLRRQFHQQAEIGPREAIYRLRINEAKRLLCETAMPLKEIAAHIGYGSPIAFHNAFKRETQRTPGAYRKTFRTQG